MSNLFLSTNINQPIRMATPKLPYFTILLFFLHPFPFTPSTSCPISICGNITIRFPFSLYNNSSNKTCGSYSPGFNLICKHPQNHTILTLPADSGQYFLVTQINYLSQTIHVSDRGNCLPKRLININISGSPFSADLQPSNTTLFTCPKNFTGSSSSYTFINCLGNKTSSVIAIPSNVPIDDQITKRCVKMEGGGSLMLLIGNSTGLLEGGHDADLKLKWNIPRCTYCESTGGMCGLMADQNSTEGQPQKIGCFFPSFADDTGGSKKTSSKSNSNDKVFKIIALSIGLPALTCTFCIGTFLCFLDGRAARNAAAAQQQIMTTIQQRQIPASGLDQSTIDSYKKVVLGESKRVPGPSNGTCPICLSDFSVKDIVRCIPECQHCFHVDCVDEWLKINSSCPVCRKSPSTTHLDQA